MKRYYIPPKQRKKFRLGKYLRLSTVLLATVFLGCLYILSSSFQPSLAKDSPAQVQRKETEEVIKTQATAALVLNSNQSISLAKMNLVLKDLPLERTWPVRGRITTYYSNYHPAIDIATGLGTPIHPFASGVVILVRSGGSLGNNLVVAHSGNFQTLYAHLSRIEVKVGDQVDLGTSIGLVGSTGNSTGPHLHFQVSQNGQTINPLSVLN